MIFLVRTEKVQQRDSRVRIGVTLSGFTETRRGRIQKGSRGQARGPWKGDSSVLVLVLVLVLPRAPGPGLSRQRSKTGRGLDDSWVCL